MSRPRGKAIQRELAELARGMLEPLGCACEVDFSRRGGHQQLLVTMPRGSQVRLELPSSPRSEGHAMTFMRQRVQRVIRDNLLPR